MPTGNWQRTFYLTGILEEKPDFTSVKMQVGTHREGASFKIMQHYKQMDRPFFIITYSRPVIALLKDMKKQAFMKVVGNVSTHKGSIYLIATKIRIVREGKEDLNGNKNDSNKLVDGQGVPQD